MERRFNNAGIIDLDKKTDLFDVIVDKYLTAAEVAACVVDALATYKKKLEAPRVTQDKFVLSLDDLRRIDIKCVAALILEDHPSAVAELDKVVNASVEKQKTS